MESFTIVKSAETEIKNVAFIKGINAFLMGFPIDELNDLYETIGDDALRDIFISGYTTARTSKYPYGLLGLSKITTPAINAKSAVEDLIKEVLKTGIFDKYNNVVSSFCFREDDVNVETSITLSHKEYDMKVTIRLSENMTYLGEYSCNWNFTVSNGLSDIPTNTNVVNIVKHHPFVFVSSIEGVGFDPEGDSTITSNYEERNMPEISGDYVIYLTDCLCDIVNREISCYPVKKRSIN